MQLVADVTALWAALAGAQRDPATGLYPERLETDIATLTALYLQVVAVRQALERDPDTDVVVTTSRREQEGKWAAIAGVAGVPFIVRTVDPGIAVVTARLAGPDGVLSQACQQAIGRWYS